MLQLFQIIALIQGFFLLLILFKSYKKYKKITFLLFVGSIVSILMYIIGDDDNNLFNKGVDWFLFDSSLFVTFFFLFFKYFKSGKENFDKKDIIFFIPNLIYFVIEGFEIYSNRDTFFIDIGEIILDCIFLGYLIYIVFDLLKVNKRHWILYFVIPIIILMIFSGLTEFVELNNFNSFFIFNNSNLATYNLLIIAFLFYFITFYLIMKPNEFLPNAKIKKYKTSSLKPELINDYKKKLIHSMEVEELFADSKLSINKVSNELNIPRQHISEVLNLHLNKSFQEFINEYRVEAFIRNLQESHFSNYTLFGIANEVGFNSKSSFNATFKKVKGITPTEFINQLTVSN
ncbi:helix-turn-helix domain-containing protein [Urechidicola croceus]|uniref:AraC family transcriptional regulator n=1 Tax=Urechidicola croceus TaxID=1850246 RepID=A0A1D8P763_9FLAO|nr:helix-turn-helix domain-containing protein [Urechidicola croceus]AOW20420.1 AraC family transcriptional regulator [Urechidicola croceus]